ncbi:arylsulfatase [Aeoliella sp. ICT_H6.2]|uniref:Arylsulfatase n=1 Tax=Aeoliella straminimaris TaxID=2954799 RepID=A0A9X2FGS8_9BACT|nr:arylsulfatase [Aeoliella straminimaris]MCO6047917.1 arylsulfatase [Aeoliella straminimaris]
MRLCAALFLLLLPTANLLAANERPNVILVMTDDQGYGEFGCHGNPVAQTPNIDKLASQSVSFTDFHVAPMCTPTRGQLLTGVDALRNAACNVSSGRALLRADLDTMADVFKSAGYHTGMFGKWHLGDNYPYRPQDRGFDETLWFRSSYIGSMSDYWENDYFADMYFRNGDQQRHDGYCTDIFFDEAIAWMKQQGDAPFFTYLPLNSAHAPFFVPEKYRAPIRKALKQNKELYDKLTPQQRGRLVSYLAMGANIDENMGKLEQFLTESGLADNTIVVFLTDNGSTFGPMYYNAGMRGGKTTLWEGGHRVPCFIRWPQGNLGEPREVAGLTQVQDLLPTLIELTGVEGPQQPMDGTSLAPVLRGDKPKVDDRVLVINYSRMPQFNVTYTDGNPAIPQREGAVVMWQSWRLVEDRWLYDLSTDPLQEHDVAAEHPEIVEKLRTKLDEWWAGVKDIVAEPQRVTIGSDAENPTRLAAAEWFDVFVDQQGQIRHGVRKNGVWHLDVAEPGSYRIAISRFPSESGLALGDAVERTKLVDGAMGAGPAWNIAHGRIHIGETELEQTADPSSPAIEFQVTLPAGPTSLQTWLLDPEGNSIAGAFYATVERLE